MQSRTYYIDSHFKTSGTDSDFLYDIKLPSVNQSDSRGLAVAVLSCCIPKSYYLIPDGRNNFTLQEDEKQISITIPEGNYSVSTFKTDLKALLDTASPNKWVYTIIFTSRTAKFTFTHNGPGIAKLIMPILPAHVGSGLHEQFGAIAESENTLPFSSRNCIKFVSKDTLQLHSDMIENGGNDILQDLTVASNTDFSSITYRCPDIQAYSKALRTKDSNTFRFYITDEDGYIINLNGLNVVFSLIVFKPIEIAIRDYIQYRLLTSKQVSSNVDEIDD